MCWGWGGGGGGVGGIRRRERSDICGLGLGNLGDFLEEGMFGVCFY